MSNETEILIMLDKIIQINIFSLKNFCLFLLKEYRMD